MRIPVETYEADWDTHGKAAGPIRNKRMLDEGKPDLVVAFPGGRGTANMISQARKAGVEVIEV
jgi:UDP-N-acetylmuramoylalanine-D-glutamate ligase